MKISILKRITFLCLAILISNSYLLNAQINDDFENGFPNGAWTGYVLGNSCGNHVYWVDEIMDNVCTPFPSTVGDGNFMTIDVGESAPPGTVWERSNLNLCGEYIFRIDVVHRFRSPGNPKYPAQPIELELRTGNGDPLYNFTINLNTNWVGISEQIHIPDGTTELSIINNTGACWNCDFAIDNIVLDILEECCEECNIEGPEFITTFPNGQGTCDVRFCQISASHTLPCSNEEWTVDYGDGTTLTTNNIENVCLDYIYQCNGTYTITFTYTVINSAGEPCTEVETDTVEITECLDCCDCEEPDINIGAVNNDSCSIAVCPHNFDHCLNESYHWDFGDGKTSDNEEVVHTYECDGVYEVCLTYSYEGLHETECTIELDCETVTIDNCDDCGCEAPDNIQEQDGLITWDPVPDATQYLITSPGPDELRIECDCEGQDIYIDTPSSTLPSYEIPNSWRDKCFIYQIQTVCEDGTSEISEQYCYTGGTIIIHTPDSPRGLGSAKLSGTNTINEISIYPNPATDNFNIELNVAQSENLNLQLIDQAGRLMIESNKQLFDGYNQLNFNLTDIPRGVYVLKVSSAHLSQYRKLVLIK